MLQNHALTQWQVQHVFQRLFPGRNYSVSLNCIAGPYTSSSETVVMPIEPTQVKNPQCLPDSTSIFLNWTTPEGDIESYKLTAKKFPQGSQQQPVLPLAVSRADVTLTELSSNTSYQISVSAVGRNGISGPAVTLLCNTSVEGTCLPVSQLPQVGSAIT
nr:receptor-type tyrosine-protein phosphatase V-like [Zootoca vivipara]